MTRSSPFTQAEVQQRSVTKRDPDFAQEEAECDAGLIQDLMRKASVPETVRERFCCEVRQAIWTYRVRVLADKQERSARTVTALRRGLGLTKKLSGWLQALPRGVRLGLREGGVEKRLDDLAVLLDALSSNTENRVAYYQGHVEVHRPTGEADASLSLRRSLSDIFTRHSPNQREPYRRRLVAKALKSIGARYPDEKKNRGRFTGERAVNTHTTSKKPLKRATQSKEARSRARRLAKIAL